jgi:hypothetical protein
VRFITGAVSQNVLVAQLFAYLCGNVRQLVNIFDCESAPAGQLRHFREQRGSAEFLWRSAAILKWFKYADRVQLGSRLSKQSLDILFVVPTIVISPVRYDQQGPLAVRCASHLSES